MCDKFKRNDIIMSQDKNLKRLAIGQSDLATIINNNCIYVDKTRQVYDLIEVPNKYFLSRPRRFGKSMLISTFNEIFRGNKELFKDQWIYNSQWVWEEYPIISNKHSSLFNCCFIANFSI